MTLDLIAISERWKSDKISPMIAPLHRLQRDSRQWDSEEKSRQSLADFPEMELRVWESKAARALRTEYQREKNFREE